MSLQELSFHFIYHLILCWKGPETQAPLQESVSQGSIPSAHSSPGGIPWGGGIEEFKGGP